MSVQRVCSLSKDCAAPEHAISCPNYVRGTKPGSRLIQQMRERGRSWSDDEYHAPGRPTEGET